MAQANEAVAQAVDQAVDASVRPVAHMHVKIVYKAISIRVKAVFHRKRCGCTQCMLHVGPSSAWPSRDHHRRISLKDGAHGALL